MMSEHGIHITITTLPNGYKAVIVVPESKTETTTYYITAPSQAMILDLARSFIRHRR